MNMFLDEVTPHEVGFEAEEWVKLSLGEKRVVIAFLARRTPIGTARALGVHPSTNSSIRRKIEELRLVERMAKKKPVPAPQRDCQKPRKPPGLYRSKQDL